MNIFFGIRIVLTGAHTLLTNKLGQLGLTNFSPFPADGLHITLRFIEDADRQTVETCVRILTQLSTRQFGIRLGKELGYLSGSKVVYASVEDVEGGLALLTEELNQQLTAADLAFDTRYDEASPRFHLSLGHWKPDGEPVLPEHSHISTCTLQVDRVYLLTRNEESPRTYRVLGWERLDLSERQLSHLAGNPDKRPDKTGHPTPQ